MSVYVSQLNIYPVKSLRGISMTTMRIARKGPCFDRHWMLIDEKGNFLTQRKLPRMALIDTAINESTLTLTYQDKQFDLPIELPRLPSQKVSVWRDVVEVCDLGDGVAGWLSSILDKPCRLVVMSPEYERQVDLNYGRQGDIIGFADGFSVLLIAEASLEDFNRHLSNKITMQRFRPNIVVAGCEPFAEDSWQKLCIGDLVFDVAKPCTRCVIPTIDPNTADRSPEIWHALQDYRQKDGKVFFGQNLIHRAEGEIKVGDTVEILS